MSGHSKWSTIKRKKGAKDAKRGAIFTRLGKDITLAARDGGGDINMNANLRLAVKKAKAANMPNDNIDRAIKKGTGELAGQKYESYLYEGYGPHGVALLIEVLSDNKNRTVPEIRHLLTKNNGNLGESGCVSWMFEKKGIIIIEKQDLKEEEFLEDLLELGIESYDEVDDGYELLVNPEEFQNIIQYLEDKNYNLEGNISLVSINSITVSNNKLDSVLNLINALEEHDDVQKVHANISIDD
jgi:YebC/PmpR family DNA-binding regulatory protein|tara:strand:- start:1339 stop:2061 length:723 start_codon:yes stop_codon:yes gene_type:complete